MAREDSGASPNAVGAEMHVRQVDGLPTGSQGDLAALPGSQS